MYQRAAGTSDNYQIFTLIITHQEYWRGLLFVGAVGRFLLHIKFDVTEIVLETSVMNNMLQLRA